MDKVDSIQKRLNLSKKVKLKKAQKWHNRINVEVKITESIKRNKRKALGGV